MLVGQDFNESSIAIFSAAIEMSLSLSIMHWLAGTSYAPSKVALCRTKPKTMLMMA